jgi:hypothetical protein
MLRQAGVASPQPCGRAAVDGGREVAMRDITDPRLMYVKAGLLLVVGLLAGGMIVAEGSWRAGWLLIAAVWGCCRAYYFCFYVIEKYIDPSFRFSGLGSAVVYLVRRARTKKGA